VKRTPQRSERQQGEHIERAVPALAERLDLAFEQVQQAAQEANPREQFIDRMLGRSELDNLSSRVRISLGKNRWSEAAAAEAAADRIISMHEAPASVPLHLAVTKNSHPLSYSVGMELTDSGIVFVDEFAVGSREAFAAMGIDVDTDPRLRPSDY
jgi:hypothetical protein